MTEAPTKRRTKPRIPAPEMVPIADLKRHPRAFRNHPADRIAHLVTGIKANGFTRSATIARDGTVLAGWDLIEAARAMNLREVPAVRLRVKADDPRALKAMVAAEGYHLDETDDRALTELLKEIKETAPGGLEGTGFDERMLANLIFVTRPISEVKTFDAAAHWVGLPEYKRIKDVLTFTMKFRNEADRAEFFRRIGTDPATVKGKQLLWPPKAEMDDLASLKFAG